jgi:hypothetical protein
VADRLPTGQNLRRIEPRGLTEGMAVWLSHPPVVRFRWPYGGHRQAGYSEVSPWDAL